MTLQFETLVPALLCVAVPGADLDRSSQTRAAVSILPRLCAKHKRLAPHYSIQTSLSSTSRTERTVQTTTSSAVLLFMQVNMCTGGVVLRAQCTPHTDMSN